MSRLAFIGLEIMGSPMAGNLARSGQSRGPRQVSPRGVAGTGGNAGGVPLRVSDEV